MNTKRITIISICVLIACFVLAGTAAFAVANNGQFFNTENKKASKSHKEEETKDFYDVLPDDIKEKIEALPESLRSHEGILNTYAVDAEGNPITSLRTDDYYKDWDGYYEKVLRACRKQWDKLTEMQQQSRIDDYLLQHYGVPDEESGECRYFEENKPDMTDEELLERVMISYGSLGEWRPSYFTRTNYILLGFNEKFEPRPDIEKIRDWLEGIREKKETLTDEDVFGIITTFNSLAGCLPDASIGSGSQQYIVATDDTLTKFVMHGDIYNMLSYYEFDEAYENVRYENLITGTVLTYSVDEADEKAMETVPEGTKVFILEEIIRSLFG